MTTLRIRAEEYLAMRRRLGFKLTTFGTKLMSFVDYLDALGATTITTDSAVAWATGTRRSTDEVYWSRRLMVIRINTVVEKQRCAQCQPHQHFQTVVCPLCGDGPMVAGDLADLMPDTQARPHLSFGGWLSTAGATIPTRAASAPTIPTATPIHDDVGAWAAGRRPG
jgi:hypothetical protein